MTDLLESHSLSSDRSSVGSTGLASKPPAAPSPEGDPELGGRPHQSSSSLIVRGHAGLHPQVAEIVKKAVAIQRQVRRCFGRGGGGGGDSPR